VKVWDLPVRLLHWTLVGAVACATLGLWMFVGLHQPAGWVALAAVLLRLGWGVLGGTYARFPQFVCTPRLTWAYAAAVLRGQAPRYVGHNPLGGWMVLALMACVAGLALTGWLYTTDAFFGDETVEHLHLALAWSLLGLVLLHVAGVIHTGRHQRENLVRAMFNGEKRPPQGGDRA
jgi:cytochrome b